jgi:hypothetical protein
MDVLLVIDKELAFNYGAASQIDILSAAETDSTHLVDTGTVIDGVGIGLVRDTRFEGAGKKLQVMKNITVRFDRYIARPAKRKINGLTGDVRLNGKRQGPYADRGQRLLPARHGYFHSARKIKISHGSTTGAERPGGAFGNLYLINRYVLPGLARDPDFNEEVTADRQSNRRGINDQLLCGTN